MRGPGLREVLPGLAACVAVAATARLLGTWVGVGIETALALGLGLLVGLVAPLRAPLAAGAAFAARVALRVGVALLGARLTLGQVVETGGSSVVAIVVIVSVALGLGIWLARRVGVIPPLAWLIAVGMAICGNSAILALAPIVRAPHRDTAYAVSTITIFGLLGVVLLPAIGGALGLADATFGTWAGLSVNDTAQVVATGYAYSAPAGDVATIVKLTRNIAILPVLVGATWLMARADARAAVAAGSSAVPAVVHPLRWFARAVPWFVIGFVVFAGLRSVGALDVSIGEGSLADLLSVVAGILILIALAGVGLGTDLRAMAGVGARPLVMGAVMWVVIVVLGFALAATLASGLP
jgi:uncharacterized integral membrane protein (TIGR00698 family)